MWQIVAESTAPTKTRSGHFPIACTWRNATPSRIYRPMQYKPYGKTGKQVSVIGFGGMRFQKTKDVWDLDACAAVVQLAQQHGVNYFDTAPFYCEDKSEDIMGLAFKQMTGQYYVSTKSGELDGAALRRQLENSLKRLGKPKINFFHIWCVLTLEDYKKRMAKGGPYEAAMQAKSEGLIDHVVFSTHCSGEEIETIVNDGGFEGMTLGYNIINFPFRQRGLAAAYAKGMGVATMNPLGGGVIPENPGYFDFIRGPGDATVAEAALRFNGAHREISTVLAGMGSAEEVLANTRLGDSMHGKTPAELQALTTKLSPKMNNLCTGCQYCEGCPQEIPIAKFMQAYNKQILKDIPAGLGEMKYHWRIALDKANECVACGECQAKCTQHLPIMDRLKEMAGWK